MLKRISIIVCVCFLACLRGAAQEGYSNIEFVENKGQWDKQVDFKGEISAGNFFLRRKGFTVMLQDTGDLRRLRMGHAGVQGSIVGGAGSLREHAYQVSFVGANEDVEVVPDKPLPSYNNYFIGNDRSKWATRCRIFQGVTYKNVYPNVDIRYYTDKGKLKYDIIVHPGGDPAQIAMKYEGMDKMSIKKKELLINTSVGEVRELSPASYQSGEHGRTPVNAKYLIREGNVLRFKIGDYSPGSTLVIDPTLVFCSFTGSKVSNWGFTATPGPDGSFFAGGIVFGSGFPVSPGAIQEKFSGPVAFDVGIIKFSSNGTNRLYATYLGGNDNETPHSMICDPQGNLIVMGRTYSQNFPFLTLVGQNSGGAKMFVAKFNGDGTQLLGCMRIGGSGTDCVNIRDQLKEKNEHAESLIRNYGDDSRSEVVLDGSNNILVAGSTQSAADFPVTAGAFQPKFGGGLQDGFVLKINPACDALIWCSYLGGSGDDAAFVLKPSPLTGDIYVAGATTSNNFPGNASHVVQSGYGGGICDGFITVISSDGSTQKYSSYLGTNAADAIYGVQVDKKGFPYVMGTTSGPWPVINAPYFNAGAKQFVGKLQPDLSAYIYSTTFGSSSARIPNISPVAFLVDRCENVYVSGWGGWIFGASDPYGLSGTLGMHTTPDAIKTSTDNRDFYFIVLKKNVTNILYATFYGENDNAGSVSEHVDGGTSRYDQNGIIYQAICANCNGQASAPFPTTPHVWSPQNGTTGVGCNEAAVKIAFNFAGVAAGLRASVNGRANDTSGCIPMDALFEDTIHNAKSYIWNFGDGSPDTATTGSAVTHTYPNVGKYLVRLIGIDSTSCNGADTVYRQVIARNDKADLDFDYKKIGLCQSLSYVFDNLSTAPANKPFWDSSFVWVFGDLPPGQRNIPGVPVGGTVTHTFASAGTYIVSLMLVDTSYCNYPETLSKTLRISPLVKAQFETPATGCMPYTAVFNNTSLAGEQFFWDFGDGQTSTDVYPTHLYADTGTYTIHLTVIDTTTCNKTDATQQTIRVNDVPKAGFSVAPPESNIPVLFNNTSTGDGIKFLWDFGDGSTETRTTMDTVLHLYNQTDSFQACLVATNQFGCMDTTCKPVAALINPLLDVPNAFTPGRFGQNGIIKVVGFGIIHMDFRIYNRWGQLVFQTSDPNLGWDGSLRGAPQPMDVYTYSLEAVFSDGKQAHKRGDITLIR